MARKLTIAQKKILECQTDKLGWDDLSPSVQSKLEAINDYETLWADASRYLSDLYYARKIKGGF